jgi:hypothetical protein
MHPLLGRQRLRLLDAQILTVEGGARNSSVVAVDLSDDDTKPAPAPATTSDKPPGSHQYHEVRLED